MTVGEALAETTSTLAESEVPNASKDAWQLVTFTTGLTRSQMIAHPETEIADTDLDVLRQAAARRAAREPLQYILGRQEFYGMDFVVSPAVLIPRPETEILVERAIRFLGGPTRPEFIEIGTGSGCIALSILSHVRTASAFAVDISPEALSIAKQNAGLHALTGRISFGLSDVFESVPGRTFDAVLSNPPYVPDVDLATLQPEVRDHEPHTALVSGPEGLDVIRRLISGAPRFLKAGGVLIFEMGFSQSARVTELFDPDVWKDIELIPDLQGIPRIACAVKQ
jgi:release factor glutamine methyltransferase